MEEPLFHRLVRGITHPEPGRHLFARCPICTMTQLSIRGLPRYQPRDGLGLADLPDFAPGVVLICGHMVCHPCWRAYVTHEFDMADNHEEDPPVSCPVCRLELAYTVCGCYIDVEDMPMHPTDPTASAQYREWFGGEDYRYADDDWVAEFYPTLPDGAEMPEICPPCRGLV